MGRRKTGETPVYSYRMKPIVAKKLKVIQGKLDSDWDGVFERLAHLWDEEEKRNNNCNTDKVPPETINLTQ